MDKDITKNANLEENEEIITFEFDLDDTEALEILCSELGVKEEDFLERRSFNGESIKKVIPIDYK